MMKTTAVGGILSVLALTTFSQQPSKLTLEDLVSVRGVEFTSQPCGASTPTPEQDLERNKDHLSEISREKWIAAIRRAKPVSGSYNKWWATVSIALRDDRRIVVDGSGHFALYNKDRKAVSYFQLQLTDYKALSASWNSVLIRHNKN